MFSNSSPHTSPDESFFGETRKKYCARFTKQEDALLKELARNKNNRTWKDIAAFLPGRTACQCRDRFNQYLCTDVIKKPWTKEEDDIIVEKYREFGPHWAKISKFIEGRSGNNVKNRWHSALIKYHGISYKKTKQERRSNRNTCKKTNEESSNATHDNVDKNHQNLFLFEDFGKEFEELFDIQTF